MQYRKGIIEKFVKDSGRIRNICKECKNKQFRLYLEIHKDEINRKRREKLKSLSYKKKKNFTKSKTDIKEKDTN